jgi:hypothetical protein
MDDISLANVDANVRNSGLVGVGEEHNVTGAEVGLAYSPALIPLGRCRTIQANSVETEYILNEAGAIEAVRGIIGTKHIGPTQILFGGGD